SRAMSIPGVSTPRPTMSSAASVCTWRVSSATTGTLGVGGISFAALNRLKTNVRKMPAATTAVEWVVRNFFIRTSKLADRFQLVKFGHRPTAGARTWGLTRGSRLVSLCRRAGRAHSIRRKHNGENSRGFYAAGLRAVSSRERVSFSKGRGFYGQKRARGPGGIERAVGIGISEYAGDADRR